MNIYDFKIIYSKEPYEKGKRDPEFSGLYVINVEGKTVDKLASEMDKNVNDMGLNQEQKDKMYMTLMKGEKIHQIKSPLQNFDSCIIAKYVLQAVGLEARESIDPDHENEAREAMINKYGEKRVKEIEHEGKEEMEKYKEFYEDENRKKREDWGIENGR
jgi:hypothetical protein